MITNEERADKLFEQALVYADDAASLNNAAGFNVAINTLKYAAAVLNPGKYGTKITNPSGGTEGYILETGIRRQGDAGFIPGGTIQNEQASEPGQSIPDQDADFGGRDLTDDVGFHEGPE